MKFHIISDLHQEFREIDVPVVECDCVIIAGDVNNKRHGLSWIKQRFSDRPVIYVCGNHEFYGEKTPRLLEKLKDEARGTNVHVLENEALTIGGVHFFGCTLWTDMNLHGDWQRGAIVANSVMNDYKRIRSSGCGYRRLSARNTRAMHQASIEAMRQFFAAGDPAHSVIVTHHAPSMRSLPERYQADLLSCAYASNLEAFILEYQPPLWVHGHIHQSNDYYIGSTRILANPRAYPDEPNVNFKADLIIEVFSK
jgi:Icc-related predicted phosphoesterase